MTAQDIYLSEAEWMYFLSLAHAATSSYNTTSFLPGYRHRKKKIGY